MIIGSAISWSIGTVLLRKWKPPIAQNTLSGWMMLLGAMPLAAAAPFFDDAGLARFAHVSWLVWFAIGYNILLAGTLAHWAWFTLARTLPVAVSGLASLPVPVVGVFAGMVVLGERPGATEWLALAFVLASLGAVLWPSRAAAKAPVPPPAD
jgi:drug/metabolite transporter (DMT)-like permease